MMYIINNVIIGLMIMSWSKIKIVSTVPTGK